MVFFSGLSSTIIALALIGGVAAAPENWAASTVQQPTPVSTTSRAANGTDRPTPAGPGSGTTSTCFLLPTTHAGHNGSTTTSVNGTLTTIWVSRPTVTTSQNVTATIFKRDNWGKPTAISTTVLGAYPSSIRGNSTATAIWPCGTDFPHYPNGTSSTTTRAGADPSNTTAPATSNIFNQTNVENQLLDQQKELGAAGKVTAGAFAGVMLAFVATSLNSF